MEISIVAGVVITDLHRKKCDKISYLLLSSCQPPHTFESIHHSLALRIRRICSVEADMVKRNEELRKIQETHRMQVI